MDFGPIRKDQARFTTLAAWPVIGMSLFWLFSSNSEHLSVPRNYAYFLVAAATLYLVFRSILVFRRTGHPANAEYVFFVSDLSFMTIAVAVTGGVRSEFANFYYISVVAGALFFGPWGGMAVAAVSSVLLAAATFFSSAVFLAPLDTSALFFTIGVLFLVAAIAGFSIQSEREHRRYNSMLIALSEGLERERSSLRQLLDQTIDTQEQERRRIARDLHDGVLPTLAAAKHELQGSRRKGIPSEDFEKFAGRSEEMMSTAIGDLRRLLYDLKPAVLEEKGLVRALELLKDFYARHGLKVRIKAGQVDRLPQAFESSLFRFIQEATDNACKHSGCKQVTISVVSHKRAIEVEVCDNGCGFDYEAACRATGVDGHGLGLLNMRERAEYLGGILRVESAAVSGTKIRLEVPLASPV